MTTPRCLVCNEPLSRIGYFDGWCVDCAGKVLKEILSMGDLSEANRFIVVGMFHAHGAETCARAVTRVPFVHDGEGS